MTRPIETTDGVDFLEIGPQARTSLGQFLYYYADHEKWTPQGQMFYLFAGYHLALISGKQLPLAAQSHDELRDIKTRQFVNVEDLKDQMVACICHNLQHPDNAHLRHQIAFHKAVIWTQENRPLKRSEKRWIIVVDKALKTMIHQDADNNDDSVTRLLGS